MDVKLQWKVLELLGLQVFTHLGCLFVKGRDYQPLRLFSVTEFVFCY